MRSPADPYRNYTLYSLIPSSYPLSDRAPKSCPPGDRPPDNHNNWHGYCASPLRAHLESSRGGIVPGFKVATLHFAVLRLRSRLLKLLCGFDLRRPRDGTVEVVDCFELLGSGWAK
jgi:hypothetical protein